MRYGTEALKLPFDHSSENFLALYSQTVFLIRPHIEAQLPNPFAIITAFNPHGNIQEDEQNELLNAQLQAELSQVLHEPIIGASEDLSHQENSFIVQISKPAAIGLAIKYNQNAIFWVEGDDLHIVPVAMSGDEVSIGSFRQRLVEHS